MNCWWWPHCLSTSQKNIHIEAIVQIFPQSHYLTTYQDIDQELVYIYCHMYLRQSSDKITTSLCTQANKHVSAHTNTTMWPAAYSSHWLCAGRDIVHGRACTVHMTGGNLACKQIYVLYSLPSNTVTAHLLMFNNHLFVSDHKQITHSLTERSSTWTAAGFWLSHAPALALLSSATSCAIAWFLWVLIRGAAPVIINSSHAVVADWSDGLIPLSFLPDGGC